MNFTVLNFIPAQIAGRRCSRLSFSFRSDSVPNRAVGPSHPTALGSLAGKAARARLALGAPACTRGRTAAYVASGGTTTLRVATALLSRVGKRQLL